MCLCSSYSRTNQSVLPCLVEFLSIFSWCGTNWYSPNQVHFELVSEFSCLLGPPVLQALRAVAEGGDTVKEVVNPEIWQRRSGVAGDGGRAIPKEIVRSLSEVNSKKSSRFENKVYWSMIGTHFLWHQKITIYSKIY